MLVAEDIQVFQKAVMEGGGGVVVVVVVNFDFAETLAAESCDAVDVLGVVLIDGEEEGVARGSAIGVAEALEEGGVVLAPALDTVESLVGRGFAALGFVVINEAEEDVDRGIEWLATAGARLTRQRAAEAGSDPMKKIVWQSKAALMA